MPVLCTVVYCSSNEYTEEMFWRALWGAIDGVESMNRSCRQVVHAIRQGLEHPPKRAGWVGGGKQAKGCKKGTESGTCGRTV